MSEFLMIYKRFEIADKLLEILLSVFTKQSSNVNVHVSVDRGERLPCDFSFLSLCISYLGLE